MSIEDELKAMWATPATPAADNLPTAPVRPTPDPVVAAEPTLGDKLDRNTHLALDRQRELLELGVDPDDHRQNRIVADAAQATVKHRLQADAQALQKRREDILPMLLARLAEARRQA
jgi:hypothetical protein